MSILDTTGNNPLNIDDDDLQTQDLRDNLSAINSIFDDVNTRTFSNKAAAVLVQPADDAMVFIGGTDGGWFKGVTGTSGLSDNGGSYCGTVFIPTGGDGSAGWLRVDGGYNVGLGYNPVWFGAIGDYDPTTDTGTDNTLAIQAAIDSCIANDKALSVDGGIYKITAALTCVDRALTIIGSGIDLSNIVQVTAGEHLIDFSSTSGTVLNRQDSYHGGAMVCLYVRDITFSTTVQAGDAIHATYQNITANFSKLIVENFQAKSFYNATAGFKNGIYGYNASGTKINNYRFEGDLGNFTIATDPYYSDSGIKMEGDEGGSFGSTITQTWNNLIIYGANTGVWTENWQEGYYISNFEIVAVSDGFRFNGTPARGVFAINIVNGHTDAIKNGLYLNDVYECHVSNMTVIHRSDGVTFVDYNGVYSLNSDHITLSGFGIGADVNSTSTVTGVNFENVDKFEITSSDIYNIKGKAVVLSNCANGSINGLGMDNVQSGIDIANTSTGITVSDSRLFDSINPSGANYFISLGASTSECIVHNNIDDGVNVDFFCTNAGTGNIIKDNIGTGTQFGAFTDADTTPDVSVVGAHLFTTANTGATSVQGLDNGYTGQEVTIIAGDALTTIKQFGSGTHKFLLKGGADILMNVNTALTFKFNGTYWYEA